MRALLCEEENNPFLTTSKLDQAGSFTVLLGNIAGHKTIWKKFLNSSLHGLAFNYLRAFH